VDRQTGKITVHDYWIAVDPGIVLQPNHVRDQLGKRSRLWPKRGPVGGIAVQGWRPASLQFQRLSGTGHGGYPATPRSSPRTTRRPASARWVSRPLRGRVESRVGILCTRMTPTDGLLRQQFGRYRRKTCRANAGIGAKVVPARPELNAFEDVGEPCKVAHSAQPS
jgi:hypothetical protein